MSDALISAEQALAQTLSLIEHGMPAPLMTVATETRDVNDIKLLCVKMNGIGFVFSTRETLNTFAASMTKIAKELSPQMKTEKQITSIMTQHAILQKDPE